MTTVLLFASEIRPVKANDPVYSGFFYTGPVYILANGTVSPSSAPILRNGSDYTLTGNITSSTYGIVIQKSNVTIDGAGFTLSGSGQYTGEAGFNLTGTNHVTIKNTAITNFTFGIWLVSSSNNTVSGNDATANHNGIALDLSSSSTISDNRITSNPDDGIALDSSSNNTVSGNNITNSGEGVALDSSSNNTVLGNNITNSADGILLASSPSNTISGNNITNNGNGIFFVLSLDSTVSSNNLAPSSSYGTELVFSSSYNTVLGNNIINNTNGIVLTPPASGNIIYHNNFVNNTVQASTNGSANIWDDGYPTGGNYWSNYTGTDFFSGPNQNQIGSDGIGDTPYRIAANNTDDYPLMRPWVPFEGQTIYIRPDGNIDPSGASIQRKGDLYTLTSEITSNTDGIIIQKSNVIIDGAGYTLSRSGNMDGLGLNLTGVNLVIIKNVTITNFSYGIWLVSSSNNTVSGINVVSSDGDISLDSSSNNTFSGNNITANNNGYCIWLNSSSNNTFSGNNVTSNFNYGIVLGSSSSYDTVSGNNITNNLYGIQLALSSNNNVSGNNIANNDWGIELDSSCSYNTVSGNNVSSNNYEGISLWWDSSYNIISGNNVANNRQGVLLYSSSDNAVSGNNITNNVYGTELLWFSNSNTVSGNNVANNTYGIEFGSPSTPSNGNIIYHNNFVNNTVAAYTDGCVNVWDDGYPSGGNYWSNYTGIDEKSGQGQNLTGSDGIGDTPQVIDENNTDYYPLMGQFHTFTAGMWNGITYNVDIVSNSTLSNFNFNATAKTITFTVTGKTETTGFCRVAIPTSLLSCNNPSEWMVNVGSTLMGNRTVTVSGNYTYIYFSYTHSTHQITITGTASSIPEFPSALVLTLGLMITLFATILLAKKRKPEYQRA